MSKFESGSINIRQKALMKASPLLIGLLGAGGFQLVLNQSNNAVEQARENRSEFESLVGKDCLRAISTDMPEVDITNPQYLTIALKQNRHCPEELPNAPTLEVAAKSFQEEYDASAIANIAAAGEAILFISGVAGSLFLIAID